MKKPVAKHELAGLMRAAGFTTIRLSFETVDRTRQEGVQQGLKKKEIGEVKQLINDDV